MRCLQIMLDSFVIRSWFFDSFLWRFCSFSFISFSFFTKKYAVVSTIFSVVIISSVLSEFFPISWSHIKYAIRLSQYLLIFAGDSVFFKVYMPHFVIVASSIFRLDSII